MSDEDDADDYVDPYDDADDDNAGNDDDDDDDAGVDDDEDWLKSNPIPITFNLPA